MSIARLDESLVKLREQIDAAWPHRNKSRDGWIGDSSHAARVSDHNPDSQGVVHAIDITHDPASGCDASLIAEALRISRDPRIKYAIFGGLIFSSLIKPWVWRPYSGEDSHMKHVHISVGGAPVPWRITVPKKELAL